METTDIKNQQPFFTCPRCGEQKLLEVERGHDVIWQIVGFDKSMTYFEYKFDPIIEYNDDATTKEFRCANCKQILVLWEGSRVDSFNEFMIWRRQHTPITKNEAVMVSSTKIIPIQISRKNP